MGNMIGFSRRPGRTSIVLLALLGTVVFGIILAILTHNKDVALLNPQGLVATEQHWLMIASTLLMLGFGVPIIATLYFFIWKYRAASQKTTYDPITTNSKAFLAFAWGGPLVIVAIIAALLIPATHRLEPQKPITSDKEQLTVQVVALNWKWLFIYPEQEIAAVNFVQIPVDTPVRFELTADEMPMSSFWIPHLAGMLYTMTGHVNPLHLMANTPGDYPGSTTELNGKGFAGMKFTTRVSSREDFDAWVDEMQQSPGVLDKVEYKKLLVPSENNEAAFYSSTDPDLFSSIVSKYHGSHTYGGEHEAHEE